MVIAKLFCICSLACIKRSLMFFIDTASDNMKVVETSFMKKIHVQVQVDHHVLPLLHMVKVSITSFTLSIFLGYPRRPMNLILIAANDCFLETGWDPLLNIDLSPTKALRAAMLKRRFADTIIKAKQKSLPVDVIPCLFLLEYLWLILFNLVCHNCFFCLISVIRLICKECSWKEHNWKNSSLKV